MGAFSNTWGSGFGSSGGTEVNVFDKLAPTVLSATAIDDVQIDLAWTNNSVNADGHKVYISTDNVNFTLKGSVEGVTAAYSATGLDMYVRYYFKVVAYKGSSESTAATVDKYTLLAMYLTSTGTGAGVSTLALTVSGNITATLTGTAKFYSDAEGTANESATWNITTGALRTIYLKCPSGTAKVLFSENTITTIGASTSGVAGWMTATNSPKISISVNKLTLTIIRILGMATLTGELKNTVNWIALNNSNITYSFVTMPTALSYIYIDSSNINYTGLDLSGTGNITDANGFRMLNYRIAKISSPDMVTLLTSLTNRVGSLPATITINDYADALAPPQSVTDAVAALKLAKPNIVTVNLGA